MAESAQIDEENYPEPPAEDANARARDDRDQGDHGSSSSTGKGKGKGGWRSEPYSKGHQGKSRGGKDKSEAAIALVVKAGTAESLKMRLENQAMRLQTAAQTAARFAKGAVLAFEEEAANLRDLIDDIRRS